MAYTLAYTGIRVRDLNRSVKFYSEAMGMKEVKRLRIEETGGVISCLRSADSEQRLELNWYDPKHKGPHVEPPYTEPGDALDHLAFVVGDVDAAYRNLISKGAKPLLAPFDELGERIAFVSDPDGTPIELIESLTSW